VNHDSNQILGRVANGTLSLRESERGLEFECRLNPESQAHRDLYASVKRGDINACSFAFTLDGKDGDSWAICRDERGHSFSHRTLWNVRIHDVSVVVSPAYPQGTGVSARSCDYIASQRTGPQREVILALPQRFSAEEWRRAAKKKLDEIEREILKDAPGLLIDQKSLRILPNFNSDEINVRIDAEHRAKAQELTKIIEADIQALAKEELLRKGLL